MKIVKISNLQFSLLLIGFVFGSSAIMDPVKAARQDSWLSFLISWIGGFILISIYVLISKLNSDQNLIEILQNTMGNFIGTIISISYIWYFIHLAALVFRNFGEFFKETIYIQTPRIIIIAIIGITAGYAVRKGLEVMGRTSELLVPVIPLIVITTTLSLITLYDKGNLLPILDTDIKTILKSSFTVLTFPFGETVIFLMIIPFISNSKKLFKTSLLSMSIVGCLLLTIILRDLSVLGPKMVYKNIFPPIISARLIPVIDLNSLIATDLLIGGGVKITVCIYAAALGITQLFRLEDFKIFVLPITTLVIAISIWLFGNVIQMLNWATNIYPYYATPFQIIIPTIVLIISIFKKKTI